MNIMAKNSSKREYLNKYISKKNKISKHKNKVIKLESNKLKIIDDDEMDAWKSSSNGKQRQHENISTELLFGGDEAPQVVEFKQNDQTTTSFKNAWQNISSGENSVQQAEDSNVCNRTAKTMLQSESNVNLENKDNSPQRKVNRLSSEDKYISHRMNSKKEKVSNKTLDGKKSGLQYAKDFKGELSDLRRIQKEKVLDPALENEISTRSRNKYKTKDEKAIEKKRDILNQQTEDRYSKWGRGLKQVEKFETVVDEFIHESSKPIARYSDDKDLEKLLKDQERHGDPMLEYMRKKNRNNGVEKILVPTYKGHFPENRFNIKPGYRWDGRDRSTGYEKQYFSIQNKRKAQIDESYKYSTEDM